MSQPASITGVPAVDNPPLPVQPSGNAPALLDAIFDVRGAAARLQNLKAFFKEIMVYSLDGTGDYGILPGTNAVALYKPGAEKLAEFYRLIQRPTVTHRREEWDAGFFHYEVQMDLLSRDSGQIMGTGIGSCNTMEARYRWRTARLACPECGSEAVIKGKEEYGGGFVCFEKKGGCKAKFKDDDTRITEQKLGQVENDDPYTLVNTVLKMAKKRALVDAVVSITRSAGLLVVEGKDPKDRPREASTRSGGAKATTATATVVEDTVHEPERKAFAEAFAAAGHKWADVLAWGKDKYAVDLSKQGIPTKHYAEMLARVSRPEPLIP